MARFTFGFGKFDKKTKSLTTTDVTVFEKTLRKAEERAKSFMPEYDDMFCKYIEETPDDTKL